MTAISLTSVFAGRGRRLSATAGMIPLAIIGMYVLVALIGPLVISYDPVFTSVGDRLLPPGSVGADGAFYPLGTDGLGRDMVGQLVYGTRTSLIIGTCVVVISGFVGVLLGTIAGYFSGWVDVTVSRLIDVLLAFPGILLAIIITGVFERSMLVVIIALSVANWIGFARLSRGLGLSLRERPWVDAARLIGVRTPLLLGRHIAPFVLGPIVALATTEFAGAVLAEAGLSFLGLGLPPSSVSWGQTIAEGRTYLGSAWWISTFPGIALSGLVICAGLLGDRLTARFTSGDHR
ncbi:ABC transporter permease [Microbacterium sp. LMI12-1-1.1]|uniref:ABC transporter permease n=1 Tax=Microbacterium sp. LMI12-1-1.1 TaxID=3135225 RepID=UPI00341AE073